MKKIKLLPLILLLCVLLTALSPAALALDDPTVTAGAVVLADADTGRIFFSKDADVKMYPASLTKVMTVLLAIEAIDRGDVSLYDKVTAQQDCLVGMDEAGSTASITPGEIMSLQDLLYCAMVESANEACNIIGEYIAGSLSAFVERMNARAQELGCSGTHFANTHGLPDENHYTTAGDMFLITQEAVSLDLFMEICNTVNYTVPATNMAAERKLSNTNGLINSSSPYYKGYYYEYARGVKTGHTSAAGYCLISTAEKDGIHLICVVLGGTGVQNADGSLTYGNFKDTIALYDWAFSNFSVQEILSSSELVAEVKVEMGADADSVTVRPKDVITALLPKDEDLSGFHREIVIFNERSGETLNAPITAGQVLGEITVSKDGVVYGTTSLVSSTSVTLSNLQYMRHQVKTVLHLTWVKIIFWLLMLALVVYILLVVRYRTLHKRHLREVRAAREAREQQRESEERTRVFSSVAAATPTPAQPEAAPVSPAARPVFTPRPVSTPRPVTLDPEVEAAKEKARRDYFEEFFRQEQNRDDGKK